MRSSKVSFQLPESRMKITNLIQHGFELWGVSFWKSFAKVTNQIKMATKLKMATKMVTGS